MAAISWKTAANGSWAVASNWSAGVPGAGDDVSIATGSAAAYTVTLDTGAAARSLTLADAYATLALSGTLTTSGQIALNAGTLALSGTLQGGTLSQGNGQISALGGTLSNVTFRGPFTLYSSIRSTLHATGASSFLAASGSGPGQLNLGVKLQYDNASTTLSNLVLNLTYGLGTLTAGTNALTLAANTVVNDFSGGAISAGTLNLQGSVAAIIQSSLLLLQGNVINNSGSIAVSNGDTLYLGGSRDQKTSGVITSTGPISAAGSNTLLQVAASSGSKLGTITVASGATLEITGSVTYSVSGTNTITLPGTLIANNSTLALGGTIANAGTLVLGATGHGNFLTGVLNSFGEPGAAVLGGTVVDTNGIFRAASLVNVRYLGVLSVATDFSAPVSLTGSTVLLNAAGNAGGLLDLSGTGVGVVLDAQKAFAQGGTLMFDGNTEFVSNTGTLIDNLRIMTGAHASAITINGGSNAHNLTIGANTLITDTTGQSGFAIDMRAQNGSGGGGLTNAGTILLSSAYNTFSLLAAGNFTNTGTILISNSERAVIGPTGTFTNSGLISVTGTGSWLTLDPGQWLAGSQVKVSNGAVLQVYRSTKGTYGVSGTNTFSFSADVLKSGGTLALGGTAMNTGTIVAGSTVLGAGAAVVGGTVIDSSGRFSIGGTITNVMNFGALNMTSLYDTITIGGATALYGATTADASLVDMSGAFSNLDLLAATSLTLANNGTILLAGAGSSIDVNAAAKPNTVATIDQGVIRFGLSAGAPIAISVSTNSTLQLGAAQQVQISAANSNAGFFFYGGSSSGITNAGSISLTGANAYLSVRAYQFNATTYGTLRNRGSIAVSNAATVSITTAIFNNTGTVRVSGNGSLFDLSAAVGFTNSSNGTLLGGTYIVQSGGTLLLPDGQSITTLAANVTLTGSNANIMGNGAGGSVLLEQSLTGIAASHTLTLQGGRSFTASNALTLAGRIALGGVSFTGPALSITASGRVLGNGQLNATSITLSGAIEAKTGTLALQGALSGSGTLQVDAGATLDLGSTAAATRVNLVGNGATLAMSQPAGFTGTLVGFSLSDRLDLRNVSATSASASGTLLTVLQSSGPSLTFLLAAPLSGVKLAVGSDGSGGSLITAVAAAATPGIADLAPSLAAPGGGAAWPMAPASDSLSGFTLPVHAAEMPTLAPPHGLLTHAL